MSLVHDYIISLTNLYGIVHKEKVIEIYHEQNTAAIDLAAMDRIMREDADLLKKGFAYIEGAYFVHDAIMMFDHINDLLAERMDKPFYIPPKQELLKYKDEFYFEKSQPYWAFLPYVTKHLTDKNRSRAVEVCEDIYFRCQQEYALNEVMSAFGEMDVVFESED